MRIATSLSYAGGFHKSVEEVVVLEQAGLDMVFVAEAYGFDAVSLMGYLAAKTKQVSIASGIIPFYSRTPSLLAMTAAGVDALSQGRCVLGLGASGPQVIEGFHGIPYDAPVARTREVIEICRKVWERKPLEYRGKYYSIPLPQGEGTGLGKSLKLITRPLRADIPIFVAALGDRNVAMTAELADGWMPAFYIPEKAKSVWGKSLERGAEVRDPMLTPLEIVAGGAVAIGENLEELRNIARPMLALYIGGMGARDQNFYNALVRRYGFEEAARDIQDLYLDGRKEEAAARVPDSLLEALSIIGPLSYVKERLSAFKESGVTILNVSLLGRTAQDRVRLLESLRVLIEDL